MKSILAATLMVVATAVAQAQTPVAPAAAAKPRPAAATAPARPTVQTPADTAKAMAQSERQAIQSDLAWIGVYNGSINGEVSERMVNAIKSFQKDQGGKQTGVLNPQERGALTAAAKSLQDNAGWKIAADPVNGIKLGIPTKLAPQMSAGASGSKWSSAQGQIQIETWRVKDTNLTIAAMAARETKEPVGRKVDYRVVNPEFFVLSGLQGLKKFYVRGQIRGNDVRGMTILYDQATEGTMEPVVIAMSSAFAPFPATAAQADGPPPRKQVEYSTGIVASADGAVVADRQAVEGCQFIVVPGYGNADKVADDKASELTLLRIYGASGLKAMAIADQPSKPDVTLTGIADPQNQGGGSAVTSVKSQIVPAGNGGEPVLSPAPGLGFSGAAAADADGRFAGIALARPQVVAGPSAPLPAVLVPASTVRRFLIANGVSVATGAAEAKASVLRVICVRK